MPVKTNIEVRAGYLYVILEGEWNGPDVGQAYGEALAALSRYSMKKALVDTRKMTGKPTEADRVVSAMIAVEKYKELVASVALGYISVAVVTQPEKISPVKIGEAIANFKGISAKVVTTLPEAFAWLGLKQDIE